MACNCHGAVGGGVRLPQGELVQGSICGDRGDLQGVGLMQDKSFEFTLSDYKQPHKKWVLGLGSLCEQRKASCRREVARSLAEAGDSLHTLVYGALNTQRWLSAAPSLGRLNV